MSAFERLPNGWSLSTLGTIRIDRASSIDPSKHASETFELYSIPAYPSGRPEVVTGSAVGSTKKSLEPRTVVVSKINPRINRVWVVGDRAAHRQIGSSEWIPFFPVEGIDPKYLAYYLRQDRFRNYLAANVSGVGGSLMRAKPSTIDPFPLVLAPKSEQHRIVEAIESYFTRLDDAVATLKRVQRNLKRYRASVLKAAVEGRLVPTEAELARAEGRHYEPAPVLLERILAERRRRWEEAELAKMKAKGKAPKDDRWKAQYVEPVAPNTSELPELPEGWCWATVDALLRESLRNGHSAKQDAAGDVRTLTLSAVTERDFSLRNTKLTSANRDAVRDLWLMPGDIFVERSNTPELVGTAALFSGPSDFAIFPDLLIRVRASEEIPAPFVEAVLRSDRVRAYFQRAAQGIAGTMPKISQNILLRLAVPLPPLREQVRIGTEIDRLLSLAGGMEFTTSGSHLRAQRLRQSILKWAFEGRLVDQDPTDEPASALLERIRAERASANDKPARRPRGAKARPPKS